MSGKRGKSEAELVAIGLLRHYSYRGIGHTHAALHGVLNSDTASLLVRHINSISDETLPRERQITWDAILHERLLGHRGPVVGDNFFVTELLGGLLREIGRLRTQIEDVNRDARAREKT